MEQPKIGQKDIISLVEQEIQTLSKDLEPTKKYLSFLHEDTDSMGSASHADRTSIRFDSGLLINKNTRKIAFIKLDLTQWLIGQDHKYKELNWYTSREGTQYGPFSWEKMVSLISERRLIPTDLVWASGMSKWVKASSIKGLFTSESTRQSSQTMHLNYPIEKSKIYDFKDILVSQIIRNGKTIKKAKRTSQVGQDLLNNIMDGRKDPIKVRPSNQIASNDLFTGIKLKVIVNDIDCHTHIINLIDTQAERNSEEYIAKLNLAYDIHNMLRFIIKLVEEEEDALVISNHLGDMPNQVNLHLVVKKEYF